jgi:outer membrane murein-binding lipoprotein Lpp
MFNLVPMWVWAAVCAVAFAVGGATAWKVQDWRYGSKEAERLEAAAEHKRMNERAADRGATGHEADKAKIRAQFITITKEAERVILEKPVYRNVCLDDDGLRILSGAIAGHPSTGESTATLPGSVKP